MRPSTLALLVLVLPLTVQAQTSLPAPVANGLDSLKAGRCEAAFRLWTATWTSPEDSAKRQTLIGSCDVLGRFGALRGYDLIRVVPVTEHLHRVYGLLRYEKQPIYLLLVAYRPLNDWKITSVNWHTNSENVLPADILPPERPRP